MSFLRKIFSPDKTEDINALIISVDKTKSEAERTIAKDKIKNTDTSLCELMIISRHFPTSFYYFLDYESYNSFRTDIRELYKNKKIHTFYFFTHEKNINCLTGPQIDELKLLFDPNRYQIMITSIMSKILIKETDKID